MNAPLLNEQGFGLYVGAPASGAAAALSVLARHPGLDADSLCQQLVTPGSPALRGLTRDQAIRLRDLLLATGWSATIRPDADQPVTDLSLQPAIWADSSRLARRLAPLLGQDPSAIRERLHHPGGLVLHGDDPIRARLNERTLRRMRGLMLVTSDPQVALHDLYPTRRLSPDARADLLRRLRPFCAPASSPTAALAEGLSTPLRDRALARFGPDEVIAVNRAFQRFELHLIGVTGWVGAELADFLALRTGQPRARFEVISPADPVILDAALTHSVARQFSADYAAIGLFTRMHLRGLPRNIDNPIR